MEVVGEFLGIDTEKGLYEHFRRYYAEWFLALKGVSSPHHLLPPSGQPLGPVREMLSGSTCLSRCASTPRCVLDRQFPGADLPLREGLSLPKVGRRIGLRLRRDEQADLLRAPCPSQGVLWPGVIVEVDLAPANVHDVRLAEELLEGAEGWALGDRNYWSPELAERLGEEGLSLLAPYIKSKKRQEKPWPRWLVQKR
jgi:hypothetical protein